jgi:adenylyltransferase/sulfurtransferase
VIERVAALRPADYSQLAGRRVVVVGCGALGSAVAGQLVRCGVGTVRVIDRDVVELRNLAHQSLYTEADAAGARPKAEAAADRLRALNAECRVEGVVADLAPGNARQLCAGADLIVDGADNLETKFLLNDLAVATDTALVYGGCAGTEGSVLAIRPGRTHCLRCLWPAPTEAAARLTCETRGVLPGAVATVAALQSTEALKILLDLDPSTLCGLVRVDIWDGVLRRVPTPAFQAEGRGCPACGLRDFSYLRGEHSTGARELCGDDTVLLSSPAAELDLDRLRHRHRDNASLRARPDCVQVEVDGCRILAFASGRTLIHGAGGLNRAKALYARHVLG